VIEWFWWVPGIYPAQTKTKVNPDFCLLLLNKVFQMALGCFTQPYNQNYSLLFLKELTCCSMTE